MIRVYLWIDFMPLTVLEKSAFVARARVKRAAEWVGGEAVVIDLNHPAPSATPSVSKIIDCMEALALYAETLSPKGVFWRELERAAIAIRSEQHITKYRKRFLETISQK